MVRCEGGENLYIKRNSYEQLHYIKILSYDIKISVVMYKLNENSSLEPYPPVNFFFFFLIPYP